MRVPYARPHAHTPTCSTIATMITAPLVSTCVQDKEEGHRVGLRHTQLRAKRGPIRGLAGVIPTGR